MKNGLLSAMQTNDTRTENGMVTNSTSLSSCVDFFFTAGAMRKEEEQRIVNKFVKAFNEDPLVALKLLFWARDVRGGAGERRLFNLILKYLAAKHPEALSKNVHLISEYGRWDDILTIIESGSEPLTTKALTLIKEALEKKDGLCAKWMPRPNKNGKVLGNKIRHFLGKTPKEYRKMLAEATKVIETAMCSKEFGKINYEHVPSVAMARYQSAFHRNDNDRFTLYKNALVKGEAKINAAAVYPYDIIKSLRHGDSDISDAQWKALPNWMKDTKEIILPVCDVSGSMGTKVSGETSAMDVSISLGIYISERNVGPFKDYFITFSGNPTLQHLTGSLTDRIKQIQKTAAYNTDISKVFDSILNKAVEFKVSESEMPTMILLLSDMEFDGHEISGKSVGAFEMAQKKYAAAGYRLPKLVYWNLSSRHDNVPVKFDESGTALVSGFSPSIIVSLLQGKEFTPEAIMMTTVNLERYSKITLG
jgi:hypothetical protein